MVTCKQHTKMNKCNYNRVFQATKFLATTNSCTVKCLLPCIYKLCDGFLAAMNKAYNMFHDEEQLEYCMGVAEEAKELLDQKLEAKRKQTKKEGKTSVEEDDPIKGGCLCEMECFTTHSSYFRYCRTQNVSGHFNLANYSESILSLTFSNANKNVLML